MSATVTAAIVSVCCVCGRRYVGLGGPVEPPLSTDTQRTMTASGIMVSHGLCSVLCKERALAGTCAWCGGPRGDRSTYCGDNCWRAAGGQP